MCLDDLFIDLLFDLTLPGRLLVLAQAILVTVDIGLCTLPSKGRGDLIIQITTLLESLLPPDPAGPSAFRPFNKPIGIHEDDADAFVEHFLAFPPVQRLTKFTLLLLFVISKNKQEIFSDEIFANEVIVLSQHIVLHLSTHLNTSLQILRRDQQWRPTPVPLADGHVVGPLTADATPRPSPSRPSPVTSSTRTVALQPHPPNYLP